MEYELYVSAVTLISESAYIPFRNSALVSLWDATHCRRARALQTRLEAAAVSCEGLRRVYTDIISWSSEVMTPKLVSTSFQCPGISFAYRKSAIRLMQVQEPVRVSCLIPEEQPPSCHHSTDPQYIPGSAYSPLLHYLSCRYLVYVLS
jgi:hypothetical protein